MVIAQTKLTSNNRITIPAEARRHLGLKAGDTVYIAIENGSVVLHGTRGGSAKAHHGFASDLWGDDGGGSAFIERERDSWGND